MILSRITENNFLDVSRIYKEGIETGVATFETNVPSWEQWDKTHLPVCRIASIENNMMLGWAALSPVSNRSVYKGVAEVSIYVSQNARGKGIGGKIMSHLVRLSEENDIWTLQSGIFKENKASIALHKRCGFRMIGYREKVGHLNGVWYDNVLMERRSSIVGI